jgi:hypothetical protein
MRPAQVFGRDCGKLFSEADVAQILGTPVTLTPPSRWEARTVAVEQHGGIRCHWAGDSAAVWLVALPESPVTYSTQDGCGTAFETQIVLCPLESVAEGIRLSGAVAPQRGDGQAEQRALIALFTERAVSDVAVPAPISAAGAWVYPLDCPGVVAAADLSAVPGLGADATGDWTLGVEGTYSSPAESQLWGNSSPVCEIWAGTDGGAAVDFEAYGGARWEQAGLAAGATPLPVDGLDAVMATPTSDGRFDIDVFDGPNWLHFTVTFTNNAGPIATALVAALDATAVQ